MGESRKAPGDRSPLGEKPTRLKQSLNRRYAGLKKLAVDGNSHRILQVGADRQRGGKPNDTEARTKVGAVRERIQVAPIPRIKHFAETILADRDVRQDKRSFGPLRFAGSDFELRITGRIEPGRFQALDETAVRFLAFNPQDEPLHLLAASLELDKNSLRCIADPTRKPQLRRQPIYPRSEAEYSRIGLLRLTVKAGDLLANMVDDLREHFLHAGCELLAVGK